MSATKALLVNVGVFEATDAVRRSSGNYGMNFRSTSGEFRHIKTELLPAVERTWEGLTPSTSATVLSVSAPVTVVLETDEVLAPAPNPAPASSLTFQVKRFIFLDQTYSRIKITAGALATRVVLHQA